MGFFSLLETFFFLSLGITFILIIMLVYHFKGRLVTLEDKYHTMFDIMNSMVKEMKNLRDNMVTIQSAPIQEPMTQSGGGFPIDLMKLFQGGGPQMFSSHTNFNNNDDEDDDDEDDDYDHKKIVVSDTELDSDDENDTDVKIISVNIGESEESVSLADLEEEENLVDQLDIDEDQDQEQYQEQEPEQEPEQDSTEYEKRNSSVEQMDFKKMDVSYLRTMVLTRGLSTDTKKMKKNDLIRLLEQSIEVSID